MSNELQLSQDLNVITAEINSYKQVAGQAIFEIGRRLKWVKENDLVHGEWEKWCREEIDMTPQHANRFIRSSERFGNRTSMFGLSITQLDLLTGFTDEQIEQQHVISSTGEQKTVDEMTVKELREVKKALKQVEEDKKKLQQELHNEKNKPVKVETKYIEKEIDNTDYTSIKKLNNQIRSLKNDLCSSESKYKILQEKLDLEKQDADEYRKMKEEVQRLHQEKDDLHRQIESATAISGLYVEIEHLLSTKLAPVKYSRALTERRDSEVAMNNLREIIGMVDEWSKEMKNYLPNENDNYIDAEVIEYE